MRRLALSASLVLAACSTPAPTPQADAAPTASSAAAGAADPLGDLPRARNAIPLVPDALTLVVDRDRVLLGEATVGDVHAIERAGRMRAVDEEFEALKRWRETWTGAHAQEPFPGVLTLRMHGGTKAVVVKSVFQTAAFAGFPNLSFVVAGRGGPQRLAVDAQIPGPPNPAELGPPRDKKLMVRVAHGANVTLEWRQGEEKIAEVVVPWSEAFANGNAADSGPLGAKLSREWQAQGVHNDPADRKLDQAVLFVDDASDLGEIVAALDAIADPKREIAGMGKVPAFNATFSVRDGASADGRIGNPQFRLGATVVNGPLQPEVIQRVVRGDFLAFRACYESALGKNPAMAGGLTVAFSIGVDGKVKGARSEAVQLADLALVTCIVGVFAKMTFPAPPRVVTIKYPLSVAPGAR